jgi:sec-independent protein translocase protein TatA
MDLFAPWHLVILIGAILLLFGGQKIPEMMAGIGKGIKEFKKATREENEKQAEAPKQIPGPDNKKDPLKE